MRAPVQTKFEKRTKTHLHYKQATRYFLYPFTVRNNNNVKTTTTNNNKKSFFVQTFAVVVRIASPPPVRIKNLYFRFHAGGHYLIIAGECYIVFQHILSWGYKSRNSNSAQISRWKPHQNHFHFMHFNTTRFY